VRATGDTSAGIEPFAEIRGDKRIMELGGLSLREATSLASELLRRVSPSLERDAATIAQEADGHPLFIDALVTYGASSEAKAAVRLEVAIAWRLGTLDPVARLLMELVALADAPIAQSILVVAADCDSEAFARGVAELRHAHLVTVTGVRGSDTIEPYHDRVRLAVRDGLGGVTRSGHHRRLALALERSDAVDPETLALHWAAAGQAERAAKYAADAGDRAASALAFDVAARLYERALSSWPPGIARQILEHKLGDALAAAGFGARAAIAYERAAEGAQAATALELRRRAAEQLFRSGHFDEGLAAMSKVLRSMGMTLPGSPASALVTLLVLRVIVRLRGLRFRARDETQLTPHTLTRVDTCFCVASNLAITDHILGAAFQARHMLLALRAGEPHRIVRALALEAVYRSAPGGDVMGRARPLLSRLSRFAKELNHPHVTGWAQGAAGFARLYAGEFRAALHSFQRAGDAWSSQGAGVTWEIDIARLSELVALGYLGRLRDLQRRTMRHLRGAIERGDLFAAVNSRVGVPALRWLAQDDPDTCIRDVNDAMEQWSKRGFHLAHYWELEALTNADLYAGSPARAYVRITQRWPGLRRSLLLRIQLIRIHARLYRGRAALALGAAAVAGERRGELLRAASRDARAIAAEGMAWAAPLASLLEAGIAAAGSGSAGSAGRDDLVTARLRAAAAGFGASGMNLYQAVAQRHLGRYLGGGEGAALLRASEAQLASEGVKNPARMAMMMAPGL
jgi:hypothetical protein